MGNFIRADRETDFLFPPSMQDWLPEDHLARFVADVVDQLDLSELTRQYAGRGSQAHHPAVLLDLLIYGYATGVFSSSKIERATHDSIALRYLAVNTHPDHDTIAAFRRRFLPQFEALFVQAESDRSVSPVDDHPVPGLLSLALITDGCLEASSSSNVARISTETAAM
jgi:transposase